MDSTCLTKRSIAKQTCASASERRTIWPFLIRSPVERISETTAAMKSIGTYYTETSQEAQSSVAVREDFKPAKTNCCAVKTQLSEQNEVHYLRNLTNYNTVASKTYSSSIPSEAESCPQKPSYGENPASDTKTESSTLSSETESDVLPSETESSTLPSEKESTTLLSLRKQTQVHDLTFNS